MTMNVSSSDALTMKAGEAVDFVAWCGDSDSFDSFDWTIRIIQTQDSRPIRQWNSERDFSGTRSGSRISPMAQLAQVLLMSNEFSFVD